jgi:hypothetical protein
MLAGTYPAFDGPVILLQNIVELFPLVPRRRGVGGGDGGAQSPELPRSGVAGSADNRIKEAFEFLLKAGKEVTPALLAELSRTNFNSAHAGFS